MTTSTRQPQALQRWLQHTGTLDVFVVPGIPALRAIGLRLPECLKPVASPFHAQALLVVGALSAELKVELASICHKLSTPYAVMTVQSENLAGVPKPLTESFATTQDEFEVAVHQFRAAWPGDSLPVVPEARHSHAHHMTMASTNHGSSANHAGHDMSGMAGMDHGMAAGGGMMSMLSMTKNAPRSADGLAMESASVTFGPFHFGLPLGMQVLFRLDGDSVESANLESVPQIMNYDAQAGDSTGILDRLNRLIQFLELCGASGLAHRARSIYWQVWDQNQTPAQIEKSARRLIRSLEKTWLLRLRLRNSAVARIDGHERDAWERLMWCAEEIILMSAAPRATKSTQPAASKNITWTDKSNLSLVETAATGLEVGDALVALASFDLTAPGGAG